MTSSYPSLPQMPGGSGGGAIAGTRRAAPHISLEARGGDGATRVGKNVGGRRRHRGRRINRQDFIKNYAETWSRAPGSTTLSLQTVLSDPSTTLAAAGMPTVDGAVIRVIEHKIYRLGKDRGSGRRLA